MPFPHVFVWETPSPSSIFKQMSPPHQPILTMSLTLQPAHLCHPPTTTLLITCILFQFFLFHSTYFLIICTMFIVCQNIRFMRAGVLFFCVYPECLEQCLVVHRCLINICCMSVCCLVLQFLVFKFLLFLLNILGSCVMNVLCIMLEHVTVRYLNIDQLNIK